MFFFFFNDTATTEIYTLSLHDALPISWAIEGSHRRDAEQGESAHARASADGTGISRSRSECDMLLNVLALLQEGDRKSTRLNSSHSQISYAVFCLKKKKENS